jgi:4-nitrophenyl phosphatase
MNSDMGPGIKTILLDMDGVLWRGKEPIINLKRLFERIDDQGWRAICITNNSTRTVEEYLQKLKGFGVDLDEYQLITSAEATSTYLSDQFPSGGALYVVGEKGLIDTLMNHSFVIVEDPEDGSVDAVVVGLDSEFNYQKLYYASRLVSQGVPLIGTNPDLTLPTPGGLAPGAGSIISAIETAAGTKARIIGKPNKFTYQLALERTKTKPAEALMIGDRLETDIAGAQKLGIQTGLVLSGVTTFDMVNSWSPTPNIIAKDAEEILDLLINYE